MARAPSSAGKTRLTSGLAPAEACALRAALLSDTLAVVTSTGVPCTVFFTPDDAADEMARAAGAGPGLVPQGDGDLGVRMQRAFAAMFAMGAKCAVVVGSDLPSLPPAYVTEAFARLTVGDDVVLGPAEDGGYYLIGLTARRWSDGTSVPSASPFRTLFEGMRWSEPDVLVRTRERASTAGLRVGMLDAWHDVDIPADLARVGDGAEPASQTRAWLASISRAWP